MQPIRTRLEAAAIAACSDQPSNTGRSGPPSPIAATWSKHHTWSRPPSSAMRQTSRRAAAVVSWPASFTPIRNGWRIQPNVAQIRAVRAPALVRRLLALPDVLAHRHPVPLRVAHVGEAGLLEHAL